MIMRTIKIFSIVILSFFLSSCDKDDDPQTIDLEATTIDYELVVTTSPTTGEVRLTAIVTNIGNSNFNSSSGQQFIQLSRRELGSTAETVLETNNFTVLNRGDEITLVVVINWNTAIEFQPEFILRISYDPDILLDDNPNNDDTNSTNNSFVLSGFDINGLF
ncbi:hypothetical protein GCM10011531_26460 [Aquaticitalea lipolytica]|uniref:CARDB domain-containing protein n=2 Tax=Aquaticitalea lipolytica TaxID=1247562 RepID=A0A8J2XAQ9_9FLAO|nr:hypothetical protein GCM10011531_26460 [Aquaticitalea lipolytica]